MCINFNGYHSGGSSFLIVNYCWLKKIKIKIKIKKIRSPSIWFRTPKPVRIRQSGRTGIGGVTPLLFWAGDWCTGPGSISPSNPNIISK